MGLDMAWATPAVFVRDNSLSASEERGIRGCCRHPEWLRVADAVIEVFERTTQAETRVAPQPVSAHGQSSEERIGVR